jgi:hypothetical protein
MVLMSRSRGAKRMAGVPLMSDAGLAAI